MSSSSLASILGDGRAEMRTGSLLLTNEATNGIVARYTAAAGLDISNLVASARTLSIGAAAATPVTVTGGLRCLPTTPLAIVAATPIVAADSGSTFSVSQVTAGFAITLPQASPGLKFGFVLTTAGAFTNTIVVSGGLSTFVGILQNDVTSTLPCTGATISYVAGTAAVGDYVEVVGLSTALYFVKAASSAAGGVTIA